MTLPTTMRAIDILQPGGPEVLTAVDWPVPDAGDGAVVIRNEAVGVNRPDCLQRQGNYPVPTDANPIPGLEVAGEIVALGAGVDRWQVGDKVTALTHGGGYAEYTAVDARHCLRWPKGFDAVQAAALPETFFTVYYNMITRARLKSDETLLVHGGSSGIGSTAIQLAKSMGVTVLTTAGSAEKCDFCTGLGADKAIDYKTEDWEAVAKDFTEGKGIDVILDMVGGAYFQKNLNLLSRDGRYALIALLGGAQATANLGLILGKRLTITGSTLRPQTPVEKAEIADNLLRDVWPLLDAGTIKPHIYATFPLEDAPKAHALMETSAHMGKIVLTV